MNNDLSQDTLLGVIGQIKSGIRIELPVFNQVKCPEINLRFKTEKKITLKTGGMWFVGASKLNDLSQNSTREIDLHIKNHKWTEDDVTIIRHEIEKNFNMKGQEFNMYSFDKSYPGEFYRKETDSKKSSNFIVTNNFYVNSYDLITFDMLFPFFDIVGKDSIAVIKFPTMTSETTLNILWLLAYCSEKVTVLKHYKDSWLKDSFIAVCHGIKKDNIKEVKGKLREFIGKTDVKKLDGLKFTLWDTLVTDVGFSTVWFKFVNAVQHAIYVCHSLLVLSMGNSVDNKYNMFLNRLADGTNKKILEEDLPEFLKLN
ncbi:mRNA capping enzyme, small subunit [Salmon gill poxvirus]|uniref:mRNA capping enzyme, small subunit n=1 Tax=Salmon gill poxvirus TaxID=1680908 RepID=A0A0H4YFN4_9POXV|nr:mRNA capping enzyme, small subunit [Salmon gill poxvirus]AKR04264.1 mRNA capping enzyme, small subunit [Salmon gill poxvirus]